MSDPYSVGLATVANGATAVTGTDTFWVGKVRKNDMFFVPAQGLQARVTADPTDNDALAITAWAGTSLVDADYEIIPASDTTTSAARLRDLLAQMSVIEANGRGLFYRFSDSVTDADPGSGYLRLNNATIGSATAAYIDNLDANGATVSAELDTWDDSTSLTKGKLWLRSIADPSAFHAFRVTGSVVDGTGYRKLTLVYVGGSSSFAADDELMAFFVPNGDTGDGYVTDETVADPSELTALEGETAGYLVFITDLQTDFGAYSGRSGVVRLIAGPDWELVALYTGLKGDTGDQGEKGWSPRLVIVSDGARRVWQLSGYVGGEGASPTANVGDYLKGDGTFTATIGDAADVRGPGGTGTVGEIVAGDGIAVDNSDPTAPIISATSSAGVNDAYLALLQATTGLTGFIGGIADAFVDQTGVDDTTSTGELYDAAGDFYAAAPAVVPGTSTVANIGFNEDSPAWGGYNVRGWIGAAAVSASGATIQLRLRGPAAGTTDIAALYVQHAAAAGDAWDMAAAGVAVTLNGATSFTLAAGSDQWSDPITFALDETKNFIWSGYFTGSAGFRVKKTAGANYEMYFKSGTNEAGTANVTGYTNADWAVLVEEVRLATLTAGTMTLVSETFNIDAEVDTANILVRVVGGEAYTVNTDLTAEVSRDGSTWELAVLTPALTDGSTDYYLAGVDLSGQPSGTAMKWRVKTISKLIDITGVSLQWGAMGLTLPLTSGSFTGPFPDGFPVAKLVAAYFFDEAEPDSVQDLMGGTAIDLTEPTNPNVTLTSKGVKLAAGLVQTPTLTGVRCQSLVYRVGKGETGSKFILSGGSGATAGVLVDALTVAETHRYGGSGFDLHTPYYHASTGEDAWEMNRGGWGFYHRQDTAARTSKYGFGGEHSNTTFRAAEMEVNCAFFWNDTLTSDELGAVYLFARQRAAKVGIYLHRDDCHRKEDVFILMGDSTADGRAPWADLSSDDKALDLRHSLIAAGDTSTVAAMDIMELGYNQQIADLADMGPEFGIAYARRLEGKTAGRCRILKFGVGGSYAAPSSTGVPSAGISWSPAEAVGTGLIWYGLRQWQQSFQDMLAEGVGWGTIKVACLLGLNDATDVDCASSGAVYQGYLQAILDKMEEQFAGASVDFMLFRAHDNDPISNATALANVRSGSGLFDSANANATSQDTDAVALEADNVHYSAAGSKAIGIVRHG